MRLLPTAVILAYHRVAEPGLDPQLLNIAPERFADHLKVIERLGTCLSLRELVSASAVGHVPRRAVVLTFDDGYADNLYAAEPLLRAAAMPATAFVTTGGLETGRPFWWDQLDAILLRSAAAPERLVVTTGQGRLEWDLADGASWSDDVGRGWDVTQRADPTSRHTAYRALFRLCRSLPPDGRTLVIEQVADQFADPASPESHRRLTPAEVGQLAASDVVEIGAHGVSHAPLGILDRAQRHAELWQGKRELEELTDAPVDLLSYPFGAPDDLTKECVTLARDCGFMAACANWPGGVCIRSDPYRLPRFLVRDWGYDDFARILTGWLDGYLDANERPEHASRQSGRA